MAIARRAESKRSLSACEFDADGFPRDGCLSAKLEYLVRYAVLAPSSHNSQPWLFRVRGEALELFADTNRALPICDPDDRELRISCGAAIGHAALAGRHFGYAVHVELLPDPGIPDLLARLRLGQPLSPTRESSRRFAAIPQRRTSRQNFAANNIHPNDLQKLFRLAEAYGIEATIIEKPAKREAVARLIATADRIQLGNPDFRTELAKWTRRRTDEASDGMSVTSLGMSDILSPAVAALLRNFDVGAGVAAHDKQIAAGSPILMLLSTADDSPETWIKTGWGLSEILLEATVLGLSIGFLNQPIELPDRRCELRGLVGAHGHPQLLLRIGRGSEVPASARREAWRVIGG